MKTVFVHVGMPKTGTTYLQTQYFRSTADIEYWRPFQHELSYCFERFSNTNYVTFPSSWKSQIQDYLETSEVSNHVLSFEGLFGSYKSNYRSNYTNGLLIKELFLNPKIILTIRKQVDLIESNYAQIVSEGYCSGIKTYLGYRGGVFEHSREDGIINLNLNSLNLHSYIENYQKCFGEDNVLVIPYELMKSNPEMFLAKINSFMGNIYSTTKTKTNNTPKRSLSKSGIRLNRFLNMFFRSNLNHGAGFIPKRPYYQALKRRKDQGFIYRFLLGVSQRMHPHYLATLFTPRSSSKNSLLSTQIKEQIQDYFVASNIITERLIGEDLKSLGYYGKV